MADLSSDILSGVFLRVSDEDLLSVMLSCKTLKNMIDKDSFWRNKLKEKYETEETDQDLSPKIAYKYIRKFMRQTYKSSDFSHKDKYSDKYPQLFSVFSEIRMKSHILLLKEYLEILHSEEGPFLIPSLGVHVTNLLTMHSDYNASLTEFLSNKDEKFYPTHRCVISYLENYREIEWILSLMIDHERLIYWEFISLLMRIRITDETFKVFYGKAMDRLLSEVLAVNEHLGFNTLYRNEEIKKKTLLKALNHSVLMKSTKFVSYMKVLDDYIELGGDLDLIVDRPITYHDAPGFRNHIFLMKSKFFEDL